MSRRELAGGSADELVGRLAGVKPTDTKVEAAEKTIALAKLAGHPTHGMERMLEDYKRRMALAD